MEILYLSQGFDFATSRIYADLVRALAKDGHNVTILSCTSKDTLECDKPYFENGCRILYAKAHNQFGANPIKKALVQLQIPRLLKKKAKRHLKDERFDLILYSTPPITLFHLVRCLKKYYKAKTFLMLKDIFPQNAVDLGMIKKSGMLHKMYQRIEKNLYKASDFIGCMSDANREYIKANYPEEVYRKTLFFPNTTNASCGDGFKKKFRKNADRTIFLFGGNMGKPQDIDFLLECIYELREYKKAEFRLVGSGSETKKIKDYIDKNKPGNLKFYDLLPRDEYEKFVSECDVGLILLNHRFTIPNYPSRILSYMVKKMPILSATDKATDISNLVLEDAKCGLWCCSNDKKAFVEAVKKFSEMSEEELKVLGESGYNYLLDNFDVKRSVKIINNFEKMRG